MSPKSSTSVCSRQVDTWYRYIGENVEDRMVGVECVKSSDNDSDIYCEEINMKTSTKS
jgi:hypothetical protein